MISPAGFGVNVVDPNSLDSSLKTVDNIGIYSDRYITFARAMQLLGDDYPSYADRYLELYGDLEDEDESSSNSSSSSSSDDDNNLMSVKYTPMSYRSYPTQKSLMSQERSAVSMPSYRSPMSQERSVTSMPSYRSPMSKERSVTSIPFPTVHP